MIKLKNIKPKYLLLGFLLILLIFFTAFSILTYLNIKSLQKSGKSLVVDIINNRPEKFDNNLSNFNKHTTGLKNKLNLVKPVAKYLPNKYHNLFNQTNSLIELTLKFNNLLPQIVGSDKIKTYFILLQNNFEIRPSGGFIGSYAKVKFLKGGLQEIFIQDIYAPDGQLDGHVDPPWPIQAAFRQGWWKLRDSNWEPDFPTAAQQIAWFFKKGGEEKSDGIVAINLFLIKDIIKVIEPMHLPDYEYTITADNFYSIAQNEVEKDFFPGSTQKKDFLSSLSKYLIFELKKINSQQAFLLIKSLKKNLEEKQILISLNDSSQTKFINQLGWDGSIKRQHLGLTKTITDYIYIVDTNLGVNKANCCVNRRAFQQINIGQEKIEEKLLITYINKASDEQIQKPFFWGGLYKDFLRIILPLEAQNIKIKINEKELRDKIDIQEDKTKQLQTIGFFVLTPLSSQTLVEITYNKQLKNEVNNIDSYVLEIQKQPGIENYHHQINLNFPNKNITLDKNIRFDETITISL